MLGKELTYYRMQASWGAGQEYYFLDKQKGNNRSISRCHNNGNLRQPIRRPDNLLKEAI